MTAPEMPAGDDAVIDAGTAVPVPGENPATPVVPDPVGTGTTAQPDPVGTGTAVEPGPGGAEALDEAEPELAPGVDLVVASAELKVVEDADADRVDLVVVGADLVATMDADRRELQGGWVACRDGFVVALGSAAEPVPPAERTLRADGCLITPGLINTHHHIYQNLTRAYLPATSASLFDWLTTLYPRWALLDEDGAYLSAWVGLAELALGGCTTSTDHLYVHPAGGGDVLTAEIEAARELGVRFHPTRGSMSRSKKDGGLPPDEVVQDDDTILAASAEAVAKHHDPAPGAMVRVALAPCSPFSVTPDLMRRTAELAEQLDVRLHTHLAEDPDEDTYCLETYGCRPIEHFADCGWGSSRAWVAHCIYPSDDEITRLAAWGTGVAHCPSSNMMIGGGGIAPVVNYRRAGVPVGLGCDGSASTDSASLWMEARNALLLARQRGGPTAFTARDALEVGTLGSAACLGRQGELGVLEVGAAADLVAWKLDGLAFAGALSDPVEAWLRCGPVGAHHTVIAGRPVVEDGHLLATGIDDVLRRHRLAAARMQGVP